jgi:hypothetical protein
MDLFVPVPETSISTFGNLRFRGKTAEVFNFTYAQSGNL